MTKQARFILRQGVLKLMVVAVSVGVSAAARGSTAAIGTVATRRSTRKRNNCFSGRWRTFPTREEREQNIEFNLPSCSKYCRTAV